MAEPRPNRPVSRIAQLRDEAVVRVANRLLRLASPWMQAMIEGAVRYGLMRAAQDDSRPAAAMPRSDHYPDTKFAVLCTLEGRKSGRVTVGESRLPAAMVLAVLRAHGVAEAEVQWPQLSAEELAVLEQLAADIPAEERPEVDVLRADLAEAFQGFTGSAEQIAGRVMAVLTEHGVI